MYVGELVRNLFGEGGLPLACDGQRLHACRAHRLQLRYRSRQLDRCHTRQLEAQRLMASVGHGVARGGGRGECHLHCPTQLGEALERESFAPKRAVLQRA